MNTVDRIYAVFADELGIEKNDITPQLTYNSIPEWDSVAHMHIIVSLEEAFDLVFVDTEITELTSIEKITKLIEQRVGPSA